MYLSCIYFSSYWLLSDLPSPIPSEGDNRYSASGEKGKFSLKFALGKGRISEAPPPTDKGRGGEGEGSRCESGTESDWWFCMRFCCVITRGRSARWILKVTRCYSWCHLESSTSFACEKHLWKDQSQSHFKVEELTCDLFGNMITS